MGIEAAVGKTDDVQLLHAEPVRGARRLLRACRRERGTGGDAGEVGHPLRAVGGDDEMGLAPLAGEAREERSDDTLVVGVREDGHDRAARGRLPLGRRRMREEREGGDGRGGECRE